MKNCDNKGDPNPITDHNLFNILPEVSGIFASEDTVIHNDVTPIVIVAGLQFEMDFCIDLRLENFDNFIDTWFNSSSAYRINDNDVLN